MEVNGEKVIEWKGDIQQLSAPAHCQFPDPKTFVLAVQEGTFRFNRSTFSPAADGPGSPQPPLLSDAEKSTGMSADAVLQIKKDVTPDASETLPARLCGPTLSRVCARQEGRRPQPGAENQFGEVADGPRGKYE